MIKKLIATMGRGKAVLALVTVGVLLGGSLGVAYAMDFYPSSTSWTEGLANMNSEEASDLKEAFDEQQATWGFVSQYGRTGRITSVHEDEKTLNVDTPKGVLTVTVGDNTNIFRADDDGSTTLDFEDLAVGSLVIVDGETGTDKGSDAGVIEVLKEGDDGFNVEPSRGDEDFRMVPLFP